MQILRRVSRKRTATSTPVTGISNVEAAQAKTKKREIKSCFHKVKKRRQSSDQLDYKNQTIPGHKASVNNNTDIVILVENQIPEVVYINKICSFK